MCLLYQHLIENALKPSFWILLKTQNILKIYLEEKKKKEHALICWHSTIAEDIFIQCLGYFECYLLSYFDTSRLISTGEDASMSDPCQMLPICAVWCMLFNFFVL